MIAIIDYGAGNVRSVANALAKLGYESMVTGMPDNVLNADAVIFPGVGAAGDTMRSLESSGMAGAIQQLVAKEMPLFAICVGMQVIFTGTEEGGWHECMGLIPGAVRLFPDSDLKIPHMGWNQVKQMMAHPIFEGIPDEANFYFVHSYCSTPDDESIIAGTTEYGVPFCSMIVKGNLVATQFHPEKSGDHGLRMYSNFLNMALDTKSRYY